MGMDYLGLYSYYLASPLNLLTVLMPESWMLPFFSFVDPSLARNLVRFRIATLAGAQRKARELGYEGAEAIADISTIGGKLYQLPTPEREGYTFMGWYDEDGVLVDEDTVYMYNGGITVTASWEQIPEEPAETGNNMIIYIVIILVLMAGVVVAIVVTKKRAAK